MHLINKLFNFAKRFDNAVNVAHMVSGANSMSPERLAEARRMIVDLPAEASFRAKANNRSSVKVTAQSAA
ncbi:MAG: hypothetical protein ACI9LZ_003010 [Glaciecola sp.]|jgi:hypothetical protein